MGDHTTRQGKSDVTRITSRQTGVGRSKNRLRVCACPLFFNAKERLHDRAETMPVSTVQ